jgi:hypothetical protein
MQKLKLLLLSYILLTSCGSFNNQVIRISNNSSIFEIQKGACYGTCPIYTVTLSSDRLVTYHGKRHVENQGVYEWYLTRRRFNEISDIIHSSFNYSDSYNIQAQDLPLTTIKINDNHIIKYKGVCPSVVSNELKFIEKILFENANWRFPN